MCLIPLAIAAALAVTPACADELTGTLGKIKDTKTIVIGYRDSSVPSSYLDGQQRPVGYAIDICMRVVDAVKKELSLPDLKVEITPSPPRRASS